MDRNFLLAFLLSTLAIFVYYTLFPPQQPEVIPEGEQQQLEQKAEEEGEASSQPVKTITEAESKDPVSSEIGAVSRTTVNIETNLYRAEIDSQDGSLTRLLLKKYQYATEPHFNITEFVIDLFTGSDEEEVPYDPDRRVNMAGEVSDQNRIWKVFPDGGDATVNFQVSEESMTVTSQPRTLEMKAVLPSGLVEHKQVTFYPDSYQIDLEVRLINHTGEQKTLSPEVNFGAGGEAIAGETLPQPKVAITYIDEDFDKYDGDDAEEQPVTFSDTSFAGQMDKYFIHAVKTADEKPFDGRLTALKSSLDGNELLVPKFTYVDEPVQLANNQEYSRKFQIYAGPKIETEMEAFHYELRNAMDLGWFEILARPLLSLLRWLQSYVVNWGVAIILLTIIVRSAMLPLAFKGMTSMRKMQALSPKINKLREKYKGNKERMNQEIMKFYSQHKVNPMGGCLPMALQIPIFIALYQALLPAIELRHTPFFLWWSDLSAADYTMVLPLLMGVTMFAQQSLTPVPAMDPTQAKIMKWMPVMMVLFFLNMPSGLVLYWVVSNVISVGQQLIFNKVAPRPQAEEQPKGKGDAKTPAKSPAKGKQSKKSK